MSMAAISGLVAPILKLVGKKDLQTRITTEYEKTFAAGQPGWPGSVSLPAGYGKGLPERVVEILFARLTYAPGKRVLDVGYANIMACHAAMLRSLPAPRHLEGIDIADPHYDPASLYERAVKGDITRTPFEPATFDIIWCISSLEHFGMDNSAYTTNFSREDAMDAKAVREMLRILAPGGQLLITVPYGKFENLGTQKNMDAEHWQPLISIGKSVADVREWYFQHTYGAGWQEKSADELRYVGYFDQANAGAGGLAVALMTKR
jgi:SAM-dependent methyltransferase